MIHKLGLHKENWIRKLGYNNAVSRATCRSVFAIAYLAVQNLPFAALHQCLSSRDFN